MEIRDPIHGAISLSAAERAVVDTPWVQRLRTIRQTGFSHLPFPGATHTRYAHSLGAMHLAGLAFDRVYQGFDFGGTERRASLRAALRVAALCHDLGHSPFSHCTEFAMPPVRSLALEWVGALPDRRATHEDFTLAILQHPALARVVAANFSFTTRHVAALVMGEVAVGDGFFVDGNGLDHRRLLSQIVSSELDVDRLDYLVRDSYYTGARYGQVDVPWLVSHLRPHPIDGVMRLALDRAAIYAFDDFMIARHHMFLMVYFHHKSVSYEEMLKRHVLAPENTWSIPSDLDAWPWLDDVSLEMHLRRRETPWAARIVDRDPYRRVLERHGTPDEVALEAEADRLAAAGVLSIAAGSTGALSRYNVIGQKRERAPVLYVLDDAGGARPLPEVADVFHRYADARRIARLYVAPEQLDAARRVLDVAA